MWERIKFFWTGFFSSSVLDVLWPNPEFWHIKPAETDPDLPPGLLDKGGMQS